MNAHHSPLVLQLYNTLKRLADADIGFLDAWHITIDSPSASLFERLPHSLSAGSGEKHPTQVCAKLWPGPSALSKKSF
jgi:hypothetical protein